MKSTSSKHSKIFAHHSVFRNKDLFCDLVPCCEPSVVVFKRDLNVSRRQISDFKINIFRVLEIEMAIFGFNLTLTLIGVFFLRKLIPILNLPPRFLKGFYRFLPPSEQMLRDTNNQPAKKTLGNVKKRKNQEPEKKDFVVNKVKNQWSIDQDVKADRRTNCRLYNYGTKN